MSYTLSELVSLLRYQSQAFTNTEIYKNLTVVLKLNEAAKDIMSRIGAARPSLLYTETTLSTVAGQQHVDLPENCGPLLALDYGSGASRSPLGKIDDPNLIDRYTQGVPDRAAMLGRKLLLEPIPQTAVADIITIRYAARFLTMGRVTSVAVTAGGTGYTSAPTVSFTSSSGSGATATATVSGGVVTAITVTAGGYGYLTAPTVSFSGGGGANAAATATCSLTLPLEDYWLDDLLALTAIKLRAFATNKRVDAELQTFYESLQESINQAAVTEIGSVGHEDEAEENGYA